MTNSPQRRLYGVLAGALHKNGAGAGSCFGRLGGFTAEGNVERVGVTGAGKNGFGVYAGVAVENIGLGGGGGDGGGGGGGGGGKNGFGVYAGVTVAGTVPGVGNSSWGGGVGAGVGILKAEMIFQGASAGTGAGTEKTDIPGTCAI